MKIGLRPRVGLVLCLIVLGIYLVGNVPAGAPHTAAAAPRAAGKWTAPYISGPAGELAAASASLSTGAGPAHGASFGCAAAGTGAMSCRQHPAPGAPKAPPTWLNVTPLSRSIPAARDSYSMAYDAKDGYVVMFGGYNITNSANMGMYGDTWTYADGVWTYHNLTPAPSPRELASMTYDAKDNYVLLFAGDCCGAYQGGPDIPFKDTWSFSGMKWTKQNPTVSPGNRTAASMAYDAKDGYVVLFGGYSLNNFNDLADTWSYAAGVWTKLTPAITNSTGSPPKPPKGRERAMMTWDATDQEIVMFGGFNAGSFGAINDTWTFVNDTWNKVVSATQTHPGPLEDSGFYFDPNIGWPVMFGGDNIYTSGTTTSAVWEFTGFNWVSIHLVPTPSARAMLTMVWDARDGYGVAFGGNQNTVNAREHETWTLGPNFTSSLQAEAPSIDIQNSMNFVTSIAFNASSVTSANFVYTSLPRGCTSANVAILACTPTALGFNQTFVNATDNFGLSSVSNATLLVNPLPIVLGVAITPSVISLHENFTLNFAVTGGTGVLSYSYTGFPPGCSTHNSSTWVCVPGPAQGILPFTWTINATVTDSVGGQNKSSAAVTINNDPGVALNASPYAIDLGQSTNLTSTASGGTGPLTYNYSVLPSGCANQNVSVLLCTPNLTGVFPVKVQVWDSTAYTKAHVANSMTTLTVNPYPKINSFNVTPVAVDAGASVTFDANATGGTGGLTYTYTNLPSGCSSGGLFFFVCQPTKAGYYNVTVTATDRIGVAVSQTTLLIVVLAPTVASFTATPTQVDQSQTITLKADGMGGMSYLTYSYSGLPKGCASQNSSTLTCATTTSTPIGPYTVHVSVRDGLGKTSPTLTTRFIVNPPPHIRSFTVYPNSIVQGSPTSFAVDVTGGTGTSSYVYSGLPTPCLNNNTATLTCSPTQVGAFEVSVVVSDAVNFTVSATTNLTVNKSSVQSCTVGCTKSGSSGGLSTLDYALIALGVAVLIGVIVAAALISRRRGSSPPPEEQYPENEEGSSDLYGMGGGEGDGGYPAAPTEEPAPEYMEDPGEPQG